MAKDAAETGPKWKKVGDLANDLMLAHEDPPARGKAVFLVGAGCSVSAGIPLAAGVARRCAVELAHKYSKNSESAFASGGTDPIADADAALRWLIDNARVELRRDQEPREDGLHWRGLYNYFFEEHLKAPNQQRDLINRLIVEAGDRLNWAHACLGELVARGYVHSVLTTNFDQLVLQGIIRTGILPVVADGPFALNRIIGKPGRPQVVHLHGSMHTYNLLNSQRSLNETKEDTGSLTMMHGILQQCDLLVVVGYAGGEEGVMAMLCEAAALMPQLVVYWVAFAQDSDRLSPSCRGLLKGENKFAIAGGPADKFFSDLMSQLGIGQPSWVADPIQHLTAQASTLMAPKDVDEVGILIRAFQKRVEHANQPTQRWPEGPEAKLQAAERRSAGAFAAARAALDGVDLRLDPEGERLHALNALSIFETNPEAEQRPMLNAAIAEFAALVGKTNGQERLENLLSWLDGLSYVSEADAGNDDALNQIVDATTQWIATYTKEADRTGWARLKLNRARAHHRIGERAPEDVERLRTAVTDYRDAIEGLAARSEDGGQVIEAKAGLAAALQVIGRKTPDADSVRQAVALLREIVDLSLNNTRSREDAGPLFNLAGALLDLALMTDAEEAGKLLEEAKELATRAVGYFEQVGDDPRLADGRRRLADIEAAIGTSLQHLTEQA